MILYKKRYDAEESKYIKETWSVLNKIRNNKNMANQPGVLEINEFNNLRPELAGRIK